MFWLNFYFEFLGNEPFETLSNPNPPNYGDDEILHEEEAQNNPPQTPPSIPQHPDESQEFFLGKITDNKRWLENLIETLKNPIASNPH